MGLSTPSILDNSARFAEWYLSWAAGKNVTSGGGAILVPLGADPQQQRKQPPLSRSDEARIARTDLGPGSAACQKAIVRIRLGLALALGRSPSFMGLAFSL
jgi:hypothetical protein